MDQASTELLQKLLEACYEGKRGALRLAEHARSEDMRAFLYDSAVHYRCAAEELRSMWPDATGAEASAARRTPWLPADGADVAEQWERTECHVLTYFRDAYDEALPAPLAAMVRRHLVAGIERLERLRQLAGPLARRLPATAEDRQETRV